MRPSLAAAALVVPRAGARLPLGLGLARRARAPLSAPSVAAAAPHRAVHLHVIQAPLPHAPAATATAGGASPEALLATARDLLRPCGRIVVLSGAGLSTDSGIPDYRSPGRPPHRPTSHQAFLAAHETRQRYWARSMQGYETLISALPNSGHYALSAAVAAGRVSGVVTQNVDLCLQGAGLAADRVVPLHGTVAEMLCMSCGARSSRREFQTKLAQLNPAFGAAPLRAPSPSGVHASLRPDADADLSHIHDYSSFVVPSCTECTDGLGVPIAGHPAEARHQPGQPGGILKPHLVFFGANVGAEVHAAADRLMADADALLVVGTSLTTWSAFRLVRAALDRPAQPGSDSVVAVAERRARLLRSASTTTGHNVIQGGSALLSPVTPLLLPLGDEAPSTATALPPPVPAAMPVIVLNNGPTRADELLASASSSFIKLDMRAADALHYLLDVPRDTTRAMEEEQRRHQRSEPQHLAPQEEVDLRWHSGRHGLSYG